MKIAIITPKYQYFGEVITLSDNKRKPIASIGQEKALKSIWE